MDRSMILEIDIVSMDPLCGKIDFSNMHSKVLHCQAVMEMPCASEAPAKYYPATNQELHPPETTNQDPSP